MNVRIDQLVKSLLRKDSLAQCSLHELRAFADQNPYFGAAQLLLTKKLQQENAADYESQLQKTYMFFHNPLWVEQLLNDTGNAIIKPATEKKETAAVPEPVIERTTLPEEPVLNTPATTVEETAVAVQPVFTQPIETDITQTTEPTEASLNNVSPPAEETTVVSQPETETVSAIDLAEAVLNTGTPPIETVSTDEAIITAKNTETPLPASTVETAELAFEPFYTIDYFASQGIKLKEEAKPTDKFAKQLKSFTDWLKTMKRLPAAEVAAIAGHGGEKKVEQLAEHSLEEKEIITEAMAEVWEKQGNAAKAIDIYTKLSLLEPAKSPYFAAKIEELKKSN